MAKPSPAKIKANRNNAIKSTGPKTPAGKLKASRNALKHGLLSKEVVISNGEGKESKAPFNRLFSRLWDDLRPSGVLEEMLVERIAVCYWRLRRAIRCEVGEIRKSLDLSSFDETMRQVDQFRREKQYSILGDSREKLLRNPFGVKYLISVLDEIKTEVEIEGYVTESGFTKLMKAFDGEEDGFVNTLWVFTQMATKRESIREDDSELYEETPPPDKCKEVILKLLDGQKEMLAEMKACLLENMDLRMEAKALSLEIPQACDKISRYETAIERQLYRAMNQLLELQIRRGVPQ